MSSSTVNDKAVDQSPVCWCCRRLQPQDRMVALGDYPEVTLCVPCAHLVSKRAAAIEELSRTGAAVRARGALRAIRQGVISRGLHDHWLPGRPLRWIGKHTP